MSKSKTYHPMIELGVACQTAGQALLMIAGALQERHNNDLEATETQIEGIDQAGNDALRALATYAAAIVEGTQMTEDQIKHMVSRFLMWKLPESFSPDGGVSFTPSFEDEPMRSRHWPIGTNVLDATQAEAMVRHMLDGMPAA